MVLESVSDARQLLRMPTQTGTDAQKIAARNELPEKLGSRFNTGDLADKLHHSWLSGAYMFEQLLRTRVKPAYRDSALISY